eukprot:SAG31_NODE_1152_length_9642_cov_4.124489_4_plen_201_part_00
MQIAERERRIADFKQLFGDPTFKEHKLTVPAGRCAVEALLDRCHHASCWLDYGSARHLFLSFFDTCYLLISVVIKHNDIVHRRCRSGENGITDDGVEWRPMFGFSWTRTMEPTPGSLILDSDENDDDNTEDPFELAPEEARHPQSAAKRYVWESILAWMQGNDPIASTAVAAAQGMSVADVEKLGDRVKTSDSETERVGT